MFTGIIEETGVVLEAKNTGSSMRLMLRCGKMKEDLKIGDSVSINGVCLSVVRIVPSGISFDVVRNTVLRTTLKNVKPGDRVNMESALKAGDPMGGHIVTGHVDGERRVERNGRTSRGRVMSVRMSPEDRGKIVERGSVAVDGVSLTVGRVAHGCFDLYIIPHTYENTVLKDRRPGDSVNVEHDVSARYAGPAAGHVNGRAGRNGSGITRDTLREKGFI